MPVVTKEQLKIWFSNFKKPPEGEFWAWLDSFRHILDKVPLDDVDGLKEVLRTKADLVNGVVPEDQLPFSVKTSEVLQIGKIIATANTAKVFVHSSGKNRVRLNGVIYERAFANPFTYTAVVNYNKILIIYALPLVGLFFLAEGIEALQALEPDLPEGAFIVRRIFVTPTGQTVEPPIANGIKYNEEDGWRNINLTEAVTVLPYNDDLRSSYWIESSTANPTIGGIRNGVIDKSASPSWDGKEFWIYNNTGNDLPLNSALVTDVDVFRLTSSITLKPRQSCKVKIHNFALEIVGVLSSGSSFPELGNDGDVLVKDAAIEGGAEWSNRLTNAETEIDTETVNRAIAVGNLQGQINTHTVQIAGNTAAIAGKVDKPTAPNNVSARVVNADNSTSDKGDFQQSAQIEISANSTATDAMKGKEIWVTASCTFTIPAPSTLSAEWNIDVFVFPSATLTLAITSPGTWLHTTPGTITDTFFRIARRGNTNSLKTLGL